MLYTVPVIPDDVEIQRHLTSIHIDEWMREDVFQARWWVLIGVLGVTFLVWWILVDKSRSREICLYATLAMIVVLGILEYGEELTLWEFPTDMIPIFPPMSSINLISLPLIYSLAYQYTNTWKRFVWTAVIIAAVVCFIVEPVLTRGGFYLLVHWKYYYSFPIYVGMAVSIKAVIIKIISIT